MRCNAALGAFRCCLERGHGPLHLAEEGHAWDALSDTLEGLAVDTVVDSVRPGPIVAVEQHYQPYPHVRIVRAARMPCEFCHGTGTLYDPLIAELIPCYFCTP